MSLTLCRFTIKYLVLVWVNYCRQVNHFSIAIIIVNSAFHFLWLCKLSTGTECGNSRGISLLSAAGKVLARVMLRRFLTHVVDIVVPESQCGFRRQKSTIDMIFVACLLQEKCCEQYQNLFFAFIDLTKAFDTANRTLLWGTLSKFGCPPQFLAVLWEFHDGMTGKVVVGGHESDPFTVNVGVKQGCVLALVIFNLFLVAVTLAFRSSILIEYGVGLSYCLAGSLFNLRRLQAKSKTMKEYVSLL